MRCKVSRRLLTTSIWTILASKDDSKLSTCLRASECTFAFVGHVYRFAFVSMVLCVPTINRSQHTQCILKYAELAAQHDRKYDEAIKIFEAEAEKAVASNLIQFNAKEYLLKAGILRLCVGDTVDINLSLENYSDLDPRFSSSREGKLFANLCSAFEANDLEKFVGSIREYDSISRLDAWKVAMLSIVKTGLSSADPGEASHGPAAAVLNSAGEVDLT
eukprot:GHVU01029961.1.p2 GENE.GHVU01029961.1~~GHVU01029961.1.p2  ORF type:complete len:218 (-),score=31.83 GHVU01029961.1:2840-3493(-)